MLDRHLLQVSGTNPIFGFSGHPDHNPVRFLDAIFLGYLFWWIPRTIDAAAMKLVFFRFLNVLGRHSLQVFAYSMIFTRFEARAIKALPPTVQLLIALITVSSLALPAWLHQVYRERSAKLQRETALLGAVTRPAATLVP